VFHPLKDPPIRRSQHGVFPQFDERSNSRGFRVVQEPSISCSLLPRQIFPGLHVKVSNCVGPDDHLFGKTPTDLEKELNGDRRGVLAMFETKCLKLF
jgi:hypothetical protein